MLLSLRFSARKTHPCAGGVFHVGPCAYKPNSVHCTHARNGVLIYLGQGLLLGSSGTLCCHSTALHPSKDLAVSLSHYGEIILEVNPEDPFTFDLGVTARTSVVAHDGGYPLPSCLFAQARVRTFLTILSNGANTQHKAF